MFRGRGLVCTYPAPVLFISRGELKEVDTKDIGKKRGDCVMDSKHKLKQNKAQTSVIRWASAVTSRFTYTSTEGQ